MFTHSFSLLLTLFFLLGKITPKKMNSAFFSEGAPVVHTHCISTAYLNNTEQNILTGSSSCSKKIALEIAQLFNQK